ncbi:MAG: DNA primase [Acidobacteriota bacterium]
MKFDDHFIDQVRSSVSIVHLVGGYVHLKKSGKDYSALCPFHSEKTPSFLVSESKQIFKCFGCGVGGDIFKFMMLIENLSFPDSIAWLAERNGIALPRSRPEKSGEGRERKQLIQIMETATRFYQECLQESRGPGGALAYLEQRGIGSDTIAKFAVGFAPPAGLMDLLRKQGASLEQIEACGLVKEGNAGRYYDKFRQRIMFPIRDLSGQTIAFGGRILGDGLPKYLNSPETILYNKSSNLYALDLTRDEIRRKDFAILVEGYFDCVTPYQYGVRNIVASLGTSLTANQVKVLGRYTRKVVINYDPDSAGMAAAIRSVDLFVEQGFSVNVLQLPKGDDPDTFMRKEGVEAYWQRCKSSQPYLDFLMDRLIGQQSNPSSPRGKQQVIDEILPYLLKMPNKIERAEYVSRIGSRLQIDESLVMSELRKVARPKASKKISVSAAQIDDQITPAEKTLLAALVEDNAEPDIWKFIEPALFEGLRTERIFTKLLELKQQNSPISIIKVRSLLDEGDDQDLLEKIALGSLNLTLSSGILRESARSLREKQRDRQIHKLLEEQKQEQKRDPESPRLDVLATRIEELIRQKKVEPELDFRAGT